MRNNAAYLPENPIVYIIFPESIHNRASFCYICMNFMVMERRLFIFCFLAVVVWQSVALAAGTSSFTALTASLDEAIEAHRHYVAVREGRIARLKCQLLDADTANLSFFDGMGKFIRSTRHISATLPSIIFVSIWIGQNAMANGMQHSKQGWSLPT